MNQLTNNAGLSLAVAVWLAHSDYDNGSAEHRGKNLISATSLLKPVRQLVLAPTVSPEERVQDISDYMASCMGTAIHDSIEHAWRTGYANSMKKLGYPQSVIDKVKINPEPEELTADTIPVYLEQRRFRAITVDGVEVTISGKFDQIINGELNDTKTTSVYTYLRGSKLKDYSLQGSIYRWINPELVTSDVMRIQHIFTDWQKAQLSQNPDYPPQRVIEVQVPLMSLAETEAWLRDKIRQIVSNQNRPEPEITRCSDEELWRSAPSYKFYSDPQKAAEGGRSTRNFKTLAEANSHLATVGRASSSQCPVR